MENNFDRKRLWSNNLCFTLRIMKITFLFLILGIGSVFSETYSQKTLLSIDVKEQSIRDVFDIIEKKSEYVFFFSDNISSEIRKKVNVNSKSTTLDKILDEIFEGTELSYKIVNRQVTIAQGETTETSNTTKNQQQSKQVSGIVRDINGESLIGVSVTIKGTSAGVVTDVNGKYTINAEAGTTIEFSYLGYKKVSVSFSGQSPLDVTMDEDAQSLGEVIVVGFGTQKKLNLTGAISAIDNEQLNKVSTPNLANAMAGKLPGLRVLQRNGEPGSYASDVDIRGFGGALFVIDGVIRTDYNRIDPNDVESISILKDASAAVYGLKAANGVVLITTKKGQVGKTSINFTGTYGFSQPSNAPSTLNVYEQAVLTTESAINTGQIPTYSKEELEKLKLNPEGTDWKALTMNDRAPQQHYNLNITGGTEKSRYFISTGTYMEDGLWKSDDLKYKRYNLRSNLTVEVLKGLNASVNIGGMMENKYAPLTGTFDILKSIWMHMPNQPAYANNNPEYLSDPGYTWNPIAFADADISGYSNFTRRNFQGTGMLEYEVPFVQGLKAKLMYSYDYWVNRQKNFRKKFALYTYDPEKDMYNAKYANNPSSLFQNCWEAQSSDLQFFMNYERTFGVHSVKGMLGVQQTITSGDNFWASRDFSMDALDQLFAATMNPQVGVNTGKNDLYKNIVRGYIGRINYDYASKYLIELSGRYDGSSRFPSNSRWNFFPAVSAGWRLSEENFIKNNVSFISNLKLRGSYGQMGDENASDFQFVPGFTYPDGYYLFGGTPVAGLKDKGAINPNITWYTVTTSDIGLDLSLWNGLLSAAFDVFQRDRDDLLATRALSLPGTVGVGLPQENLEQDRTRGFEIELGHRNSVGDFNYNFSGNITYTRTKWIYREQAPQGNSVERYRYNLNNRYNDIWWGYNYVGTITSLNQSYLLPVHDGKGNSTALPGDKIMEDKNQDGVIDDWDVTPLCNNSRPLLNYGFTIDLSWKGFDLNALFQGASLYNVKYAEQLDHPLSWGRNGLDMFMDRWHKEDMFDPASAWVPGTFPTTGNSWGFNGADSKFRIHDITYLRLKSLELGYTLPSDLTQKARIDKARFFINGFNLFTYSTVNKIIDPEQNAGDWGYTYPIMRNYNIGVSVTF